VKFQEDSASELSRAAAVEVENKFYNYSIHGHLTAQYPKVICWDAPASGRKVRLNQTAKKYKYTANLDEHQLHVYVLKQMDGIKVMSRRDLKNAGIDI
jgi:hypothetical protein